MKIYLQEVKSKKTSKKNLFFVGILSATDEKSRIRIRFRRSRIHNTTGGVQWVFSSVFRTRFPCTWLRIRFQTFSLTLFFLLQNFFIIKYFSKIDRYHKWSFGKAFKNRDAGLLCTLYGIGNSPFIWLICSVGYVSVSASVTKHTQKTVSARGLQRDVVYLGWPIAPSYISQNGQRD